MAARAFMVAAIAPLLLWLPSIGSHSQEPNRQLMQTGSANTNITKRLALVIGNGGYTNAPPLKNPPNDARDMAATLKVLGFSVSSAIDADQRTMKRLIREFGQQLILINWAAPTSLKHGPKTSTFARLVRRTRNYWK
jgi:hypothetical protein